MYYTTKKNSETGKKFQEIIRKSYVIREEQAKLANEFGFNGWTHSEFRAIGGFGSLQFKKEPDNAVYRKLNDGNWLPRRNTKAGKIIHQKLEACPSVTWHELNSCIGFESRIYCIGFYYGNKDYFVFIVDKNWGPFQPPADCKEISAIECKSYFK